VGLRLRLFAGNCIAGFARPLASPGICARALAAHWQATLVPHSAITAKIHQAFDIHRDLSPEISFNYEFSDLLAQSINLGICQILHLDSGFYASGNTYGSRARTADAVYRGQCDLRVLMVGNIDSSDTSHDLSFN